MEDITGLIIYIILAIIGVLASVYRNKSKKKAVITKPLESATTEAEPEEIPERTFDPFAGLFEEKLEEEDMTAEIEVNEKDMASDTEVNEEELVEGKNINLEETITATGIDKEDGYKKEYYEGEAVFEETSRTLISESESGIIDGEISDAEYSESITETEIDSSAIREEEDTEKKELFDLRKAVIYSEILKRREY